MAPVPRAVVRLLALLPARPVGAAGARGSRRGGGARARLPALLAQGVPPSGVSPVHGAPPQAPRQVRGLLRVRGYQRDGPGRQPGPGLGQDGGGTDGSDARGASRVSQVHRVQDARG